MTTESLAIEAQSVRKVFGAGEGRIVALDEVDLQIADNEFFTLLGPSGCGKTTLLRLIAGFEQPDAGQIQLFGQPIADLPPKDRPVNTVFQNYALFPHMTVAQNIAFGLEMQGRSATEIERIIADTLALVRMEAFAERQPSQLSGGQQQRIALARALAPEPKVLLLDEPLSALDLKLRQQMRLELKTLQARAGITFIFVTHDQEEALTMSDRIAVMSAGAVQQVGAPKTIYDDPANRFVADFIGDANLLPARVTAAESGAVICELAPGLSLRCETRDTYAGGREVTLFVRPEQVTLHPDTGDDDKPAGKVTEAAYLGADSLYSVALPNDLNVRARAPNAELSVGQPVRVTFSPESLRILTD